MQEDLIDVYVTEDEGEADRLTHRCLEKGILALKNNKTDKHQRSFWTVEVMEKDALKAKALRREIWGS